MIEISNLVKKYGKNYAVNDISFNVEKGEIVGFLGPNGAGKSTTMNILTGYLSATSGTVKIAGYDILENPMEAKKHIGFLPEHPPLYLDMTVKEYLDFVFDLKKCDLNRKKHISEIVDVINIGDVYKRPIGHLSKGYRQRVGIAQALISSPDLLIFDEPTVGLDPKQIIEIRELIKSLKENHTVFLSSHILSEVSAICDYVLIIADGKLVASDTPENLSKHISGCLLDISVKGARKAVVTTLKKIKGVKNIEVVSESEDGIVRMKIHSDTDIRAEVFFALCELKMPVMELTSNNMSLEDIFLKLTDTDTEDEEDADETVDSEVNEKEYTPLFTSDVNDTKGDEE